MICWSFLEVSFASQGQWFFGVVSTPISIVPICNILTIHDYKEEKVKERPVSEVFFSPFAAMGCITMWSLNTTLTILFSLLLTIFSVGFCRCRSSLGVVLEWQTVHQRGCRSPVPVVQHTWRTMDSCLQPVAPGRAMVTAASLLAFEDTYE